MSVKEEILINPVKAIVKETDLKHIAIIMDGNRRWAKLHNLPTASGHSAGVKALKNIVTYSSEFGIKYLTVYAFSTENWGRKPEEVNFLMFLLGETFKKELGDLHKNNVKIKIIGDLERLSKELKNVLTNAEQKTADNTGLQLQIAINYGGRAELVNAVKKIAENVKNGIIETCKINEELISGYLYTSNIPDPDLLIRTGGDLRVSNYLLWQIAYTELYPTQTLWPDFGKLELENAVREFASRNRRFGKG